MSKRLCGRVLGGPEEREPLPERAFLVLRRSGPRRIGWNGYLGGGCGVVSPWQSGVDACEGGGGRVCGVHGDLDPAHRDHDAGAGLEELEA